MCVREIERAVRATEADSSDVQAGPSAILFRLAVMRSKSLPACRPRMQCCNANEVGILPAPVPVPSLIVFFDLQLIPLIRSLF